MEPFKSLIFYKKIINYVFYKLILNNTREAIINHVF
jgi:hypothetical protein